MEISNWQDDILAEQSLWHVFRGSSKLGSTRFNFLARALFLISSGLLALWAAYEAARIPMNNTLGLVSWMASALLSLTVSVLGFLIAGFSIFVTLSDRKLLIEMAKTPYAKSGLSVFKYIFFSFMIVFVYYLVGVALSFGVGAFAQLKWDIDLIPLNIEAVRLVNIFTVWMLSAVFFELMLRLKSFVWSIYSSFISKLLVEDLLSNDGSLSA